MAIKTILYQDKKFTISYDIVNFESKTDLVFLHGWGSNKEIMKQAFGRHLGEFRHIYIDLPGFGKSTSDSVLGTRDYAAIVDLFLESIGAKKLVVVGHSFGGKVAALLNPRLLVLLSSAGIVCSKPFWVRSKIALFKLLKPLGFGKIRRFFVSADAKGLKETMYLTFKNVVDENFESVFAGYFGDALLFWGEEDTATPIESGRRIKELIKKSTLYSYSGDHYFFMKHAGDISKKIKECYEKL